MDRKLHIFLVFSIIVIVFSNSFSLIYAQISSEKPIRFSVNVWAPNFLAYIAQEKGYFEKNNVNVNLTLIQDYSDAVRDYANGKHDGMFVVYSDVIVQDSEGIDTKVVYNIDTSYDADAIIGSVNNLTEVMGKKVGVEGINSFSHYFMLKSLENVGLSEANVEFVNIPAQNISDALKKSEIDAGHTYNPYISDSLKNGFKILSIGANAPGVITTVLAFHSDIVKQRPLDVQNIIKSLIEAKEDYDKNREQDIEIMSVSTGINKTDIINGMDGAKLLDLDYNTQFSMNKELNTTASLYNSGKSIAKFYAERGVITEYPDIEDIIEPKFVNELLMEKNQ
ncbi:ABC transporter substrate-binding protein [Candidatus Nitrosocosmicus arcticus]|uniref:ABC transporter substrate-binding protein n=1 Tax=Candidatus Nitrosocosmicus arcticus TaxID=2035267 RepID=UPI001644F733|nr:ABC transporter substrate-binding protein [Candidatus Nitrosocosmicus arcticus]